MFQEIIRIFKDKDLRNKILFVLFVLVVYRLAANIPIPGIDTSRVAEFFNSDQLFGLLNMFSGGGLKNISIVMLGVGPYITASIIMQLLMMIFPRLEQMYKEEGEAGQQKFNMITRYLTVPLAAIQTLGMIALLRSNHVLGHLTIYNYIVIVIIATAGTIFLMWLGELITEKGIGNGVSILIFAGIVIALPTTIKQIIATWDPTYALTYLGFLVLTIITVAAIVVINEATRNIPITFARRIRGTQGGAPGSIESQLPLKVNQAGVIPIIFAMSIMLFPGMISNLLAKSHNPLVAEIAGKVADLFANQWFYGIVYFILVVAFTFFYTAVTFDPKTVAENLQRQGGFIANIRPGEPTVEYLNYLINRITLSGAIFLGFIAVLPFIVQAFTGNNNLTIGGTGILIVVAVVIEMIKQIEAQLVMRDYDRL